MDDLDHDVRERITHAIDSTEPESVRSDRLIAEYLARRRNHQPKETDVTTIDVNPADLKAHAAEMALKLRAMFIDAMIEEQGTQPVEGACLHCGDPGGLTIGIRYAACLECFTGFGILGGSTDDTTSDLATIGIT